MFQRSSFFLEGYIAFIVKMYHGSFNQPLIDGVQFSLCFLKNQNPLSKSFHIWPRCLRDLFLELKLLGQRVKRSSIFVLFLAIA